MKPKPTWAEDDVVTMGKSDGVFRAGEELVVINDPGTYIDRKTGTLSTRRGATVLARPGQAKTNGAGHYWVEDDYIVHNPIVSQKDVDEAIKSILHGKPEGDLMQGEIIYDAEMREAMKHQETLDQVIKSNPGQAAVLEPVRDFLLRLAWKGQER